MTWRRSMLNNLWTGYSATDRVQRWRGRTHRRPVELHPRPAPAIAGEAFVQDLLVRPTAPSSDARHSILGSRTPLTTRGM